MLLRCSLRRLPKLSPTRQPWPNAAFAADRRTEGELKLVPNIRAVVERTWYDIATSPP